MHNDHARQPLFATAVVAFNMAAIGAGCVWSHAMALVRLMTLDDKVTSTWTPQDWHASSIWLVNDAILRTIMAGAVLWLVNRGAARRRLISLRLGSAFVVAGCVGVLVASYPILAVVAKAHRL